MKEPSLHKGREPTRLIPRSTPSQPWTPQRSQLSTAHVANFAVPGSTCQLWPAPPMRASWSDQPARPAAEPKPATVRLKLVAAGPRPAPWPVPAAMPAWYVMLPGVMAGKQPAPKPSDLVRGVRLGRNEARITGSEGRP